MKKLMFMLAAVAMATSAQSAAVTWTCTNVKDSSGNAINGIAYFINAATLSQDAFRALNGADAFTTALTGMYSWAPTAHGYAAGKYNGDDIANETLGLADASDYSVYLAVFDTATITDSSNYYLTSAQDLSTYAGSYTATVKFGSQSTPSQADGAWSSVKGADPDPGPLPTPEPTSGLLMLIGAAGLALRRKRA